MRHPSPPRGGELLDNGGTVTMTTNRRTISISPRRHGSALTTECRLRWPATAAAFVVLLGISGCGGGDDGAGAASVDTSDETSAVDAAFVDRAEAVCMPYADYT
jgi:hypothetical protein